MIDIKIEGDWRKKIDGFVSFLKGLEGAECTIHPTKVLEEHSKRKSAKLLAVVSASVVERTKAEQIPKIKEIIRNQGEGWEQRVAAQYRRWAYRYLEELYVDVRDQQRWGRVLPSTAATKAAAQLAEKEQRKQDRAAQPKEPRKPSGPRGPRKPRQARAPKGPTRMERMIQSYGVRDVQPDWRALQKGKMKSGPRRPDIVEDKSLIVVKIRGQVISRE